MTAGDHSAPTDPHGVMRDPGLAAALSGALGQQVSLRRGTRFAY
ncbi:hypothetical protein [Trebonia kvetii]|nr:hypothetical protein [Trebonia kvetii]